MPLLNIKINPMYAAFFVVIVTTVFLALYRFVFLKDFFYTIKIPCDPETSTCFVDKCTVENPTSCPDDEVAVFKLAMLYEPENLACDSKECIYKYCEDSAACDVIECSEKTLLSMKNKDLNCLAN